MWRLSPPPTLSASGHIQFGTIVAKEVFMAVYLIGDIQGCDEPLARLLQKVDFSPSRDELFVLGDLVNRGPDSVGVLRRLMALGPSVQCVLGNHDLHALAVPRARAQAAAATPCKACCRPPTAMCCSAGCGTSPWRCTPTAC
jgi:fructose-1,6-bisphosphatase